MTLVVAWWSMSIAGWWVCSSIRPFDIEQHVVQGLEGLVQPALSSSFPGLLEAGIEPRRVSDFCLQRTNFRLRNGQTVIRW